MGKNERALRTEAGITWDASRDASQNESPGARLRRGRSPGRKAPEPRRPCCTHFFSFGCVFCTECTMQWEDQLGPSFDDSHWCEWGKIELRTRVRCVESCAGALREDAFDFPLVFPARHFYQLPLSSLVLPTNPLNLMFWEQRTYSCCQATHACAHEDTRVYVAQ